ncbi:hypothetical protein F5887DRAFT_1286497 [Amanita rubescens]|nr:hypothetical protein F5887DRAFT_1286497 [Amanita rubescens]
MARGHSITYLGFGVDIARTISGLPIDKEGDLTGKRATTVRVTWSCHDALIRIMGVTGLWEVLKPAAETRSMTELAITEGFIANPQGLRGFRIGIDASIWFFHAEYGKEGENPVLRTLFFRCATLMRTTFLPLFVFDGPKRPNFKRGKKINKSGHKLIPGMKAIIEAFGFEWRMAPAEAEAELAYLNRAGIIDAVLSDDVDNFLFGATTVIRNLSNNLSGNRAIPILNSQGRDDKNHTRLYRALTIRNHSSISLTRGGLVLIGLLSGGDYAQAGLPGCGITTAHALARCGFGDSLYEAATTLPADALPDFLIHWRQNLREELRTNSRGIIGRKLGKLAKQVPNSFPNIDILLSYTNPMTSESLGRAAEKNVKLTWGKEPDVGKLAAICEFYFEWGYKEAIIKRSRTLLWHSIVLRILRRAVINAETSEHSSSSTTMPSTPRKGKDRAHPRIINTPSKMVAKHFASMGLNSPEPDDEEPLIVMIHSSRNHASTDGLLEYRLEVAPAQLVRLAESGIKGTRESADTNEWAPEDDVGEDDDDDDAGKKTKGPKPHPDPTSHLRLWMPACMVEMAEQEIVEEYNERRSKKASKKNGKAREESGAKKKVSKSHKPLYDSDTDQQQPLEDMLAKRKATIQSAPSRRADGRMVLQALFEESQESESDALLSTPTFTAHSRAESSKTAAKPEKWRKPGFGYLLLSDEDEQSPFPISFNKEDDVFSSSDTHGQLNTMRPTKTSLKRSPSQTSDFERYQSPQKSLKRTLVEIQARSTSPSRTRAAKAKAINTSAIDISPDDLDDSDARPAAVSMQRFIVPPLMLAKARAQSNRATRPRTFRDETCDVIDLT